MRPRFRHCCGLRDTSHWLPPLISVGGSANCQFASVISAEISLASVKSVSQITLGISDYTMIHWICKECRSPSVSTNETLLIQQRIKNSIGQASPKFSPERKIDVERPGRSPRRHGRYGRLQ